MKETRDISNYQSCINLSGLFSRLVEVANKCDYYKSDVIHDCILIRNAVMNIGKPVKFDTIKIFYSQSGSHYYNHQSELQFGVFCNQEKNAHTIVTIEISLNEKQSSPDDMYVNFEYTIEEK